MNRREFLKVLGISMAVAVLPLPKSVRHPDVPTGSIFTCLYQPTVDLPTGWLLCDGSSVPIRKYPELFVALGDNKNPLGAGWDGKSSKFRLPDLRGTMLKSGYRHLWKDHTLEYMIRT